MIDDILDFNRQFVLNKQYLPFLTNKYPDKKLAIVSCMDTRLTHLLLSALGLKNGDVKLIKNAGGVVASPFDSTVRSLLVAVYELGVEDIMVVGHTDCGAQHLDASHMISLMLQKGVSQEHLDMMRYCGINFEAWLSGFPSPQESVSSSVKLLRLHPLFPDYVNVRGFVINSETGLLSEVLV